MVRLALSSSASLGARSRKSAITTMPAPKITFRSDPGALADKIEPMTAAGTAALAKMKPLVIDEFLARVAEDAARHAEDLCEEGSADCRLRRKFQYENKEWPADEIAAHATHDRERAT